MKVDSYKKRYGVTKHYGLLHGLRPPFICPWKAEGCNWVSNDQQEHQKHIREVHEIPGEKERGLCRNQTFTTESGENFNGSKESWERRTKSNSTRQSAK